MIFGNLAYQGLALLGEPARRKRRQEGINIDYISILKQVSILCITSSFYFFLSLLVSAEERGILFDTLKSPSTDFKVHWYNTIGTYHFCDTLRVFCFGPFSPISCTDQWRCMAGQPRLLFWPRQRAGEQSGGNHQCEFQNMPIRARVRRAHLRFLYCQLYSFFCSWQDFWVSGTP